MREREQLARKQAGASDDLQRGEEFRLAILVAQDVVRRHADLAIVEELAVEDALDRHLLAPAPR